jgi:hypothetical protein
MPQPKRYRLSPLPVWPVVKWDISWDISQRWIWSANPLITLYPQVVVLDTPTKCSPQWSMAIKIDLYYNHMKYLTMVKVKVKGYNLICIILGNGGNRSSNVVVGQLPERRSQSGINTTTKFIVFVIFLTG